MKQPHTNGLVSDENDIPILFVHHFLAALKKKSQQMVLPLVRQPMATPLLLSSTGSLPSAMSKTSRVKDVHYQVYKHLSGMSGIFSSRMRRVGDKEVLESTRPETPFSSQSPCVLLFHLPVKLVLFPSNPS